MKFIFQKDDSDGLEACMVSECKRIHMGIYAVLFGYRVRAGFYANRYSYYELDYCCGDSQMDVELIYSIVKNILEQQEYSLDIFKIFPAQERKPFFTDTENWDKLLSLTKNLELVKLPPVIEIRRKQLSQIFGSIDKK